MSTEPDRDPVTDPLLRKALQPTQTGTDGCVDAETLAAWSDGDLPADRAADVEAHLAGCSRCQAVLSAFAMTDESAAPAASPASVIPFTPKSRMRWLLPLAASIAATLVLWTAVRNRTPTPLPESQQALAKSEAPASRLDATAPASPAPTPPAPAEKRLQAARKESTVAANATKMSAAPRPAAAPVAAPTGNAAADRALAAPPPPPAQVAAPPPPVQVVAGSQLVQNQRSMAEAVKIDALTDTSKVVAEFMPRMSTTMDRVAAGTAGAGGAGGAAGGRGGGGGAARLAVTPQQPTGPARWRIMGSGQVMKSTNGGDTWVPVPLAPPAFIVSGDAPSASVCWLVGRAGLVMRSTDATTFVRIVFPDASDLKSITAIDARQATVTTASGQIWATIDGGDTWRKLFD